MKEKIALIEFYPYHIELIYSQVAFLKEGNIPFSFITDKRNKGKIDFLKKEEVIYYDFKKMGSLWNLRKFIVKSEYSHLIFNTAQGNKMLKFAIFPLPRKIKTFGILHNVNKIKTSKGQKFICKKISSFFVLANYMKTHLHGNKGLRSQQINLIYHPPIKDIPNIHKEKNTCWIGIPGTIEFKRRDYNFLLKLTSTESFPDNCKFVLLGNSTKQEGPDFIQRIKKLGIENYFIWFDDYVPDGLFHAYMEKMDYLLPLIHPSTQSAYDYLKYKVSGTFIQAKAYSKPLICHQIFNKNDFDFPAIYYKTTEDIFSIIEAKKTVMIPEKADFETERKKYISFIRGQ